MHEIAGINSTASNFRISEIERYPLKILEPTMKVQVHMQASTVKKIDKPTKKEPIIRFWG